MQQQCIVSPTRLGHRTHGETCDRESRGQTDQYPPAPLCPNGMRVAGNVENWEVVAARVRIRISIVVTGLLHRDGSGPTERSARHEPNGFERIHSNLRLDQTLFARRINLERPTLNRSQIDLRIVAHVERPSTRRCHPSK